jgi:hypothetical protein
MSSQQACPPKSVWQHIVSAGFADVPLGDLGAHLDGCPACQAAVEGLMGRERTSVTIAAALRQELPPASPVCQRMLDELQEQEPSGPITSGEAEPQSDTHGKSVCCPHCLEWVHMQEAVGCEPMRCPNCWRAPGEVDGQDAVKDYEVTAQEEAGTEPTEVQKYVQSLEDRARRERKRHLKPYHRGGVPVNLVAGVFLILCGLALLLNAFLGDGGYMGALINRILPAFVMFLLAAMCLVFWKKG